MNKKKMITSFLLLALIASQSTPLAVLAADTDVSSTENLQQFEEKTDDSSSVEESATVTSTEQTAPEASQSQSTADTEKQSDETSEEEASTEDTQVSDDETETEPSLSSEPDQKSAETQPTNQQPKAPAAEPKSQANKAQTAPSASAAPQAAADKRPTASLPKSPDPSALSPIRDAADIPRASVTAGTYVKHWSGSDAYSHHLLSRRYGITATQLDGFLKSTGIAYDSKRINGAKLLDWEKKSGLDVRAIVAIAMAESSLGTAGVAKNGANMFGYAAFDSDPDQAMQYDDEAAVQRLTAETIIQNKNTSFQIQDAKAQNLALGRLNSTKDGGVYFTDASGSGRRRAQIMENLDKWIDSHGGTPEVPAELRNLPAASIASVPVGYKTAKAINTAGYLAASYPWGECTWYVYGRAQELGYHFGAYMGNGGDWKSAAGYDTSHTPQVGYAVSFSPGQAGADGTYGHVAIVEQVKEDGSILISESNALGRGLVSYRTFTAEQAKQLTYVIGKKVGIPQAESTKD